MRMEQVLVNVLRNAVQSAPDTNVDASVVEHDGSLHFMVRDRGEGITSPATLFEPFHTTRARGTGLGLAICQRIVELHGGRIDASNHPGGGAVFEIVLPPGTH